MRFPFVAILVGSLVARGFGQDNAAVGLEVYLSKDLRKLDEAEAVKFWQTFYALTGDAPEERKKYQSYEPWHLGEFRAGSAKWIFVEVYPNYEIPGYSLARVHLFDKEWKRLSHDAFPTGYRASVQEVAIKPSAELEQDLLVLKIVSTASFLGLQRPGEQRASQSHLLQYYALIGNRVALIRVENEKNHVVRSGYSARVPSAGPQIPARTKDEWVKTLSSETPTEPLATLVWLTGGHLKSTEPRFKNVNQESVAHSELFEAVRDAPETKAALTELRSSQKSWVREYATLALTQAGE